MTAIVRFAEAHDLIDLRHRVLRSTLPREAAMFELDHLPDSFHVAAFDGPHAVCCATFHPGQWDGEPAWQLRGMATDAAYRGKRLGQRVLAAAERFMAVHPLDGNVVRLMWANCRVGALNFYQRQGWAIASDMFEIEVAGMHYKMFKRLPETVLADASGRLERQPDGGLFATEPIEAGTLLLRMSGSKSQMNRPSDDVHEPDARSFVRGESDVMLVAVRDIAAGTRVVFDR